MDHCRSNIRGVRTPVTHAALTPMLTSSSHYYFRSSSRDHLSLLSSSVEERRLTIGVNVENDEVCEVVNSAV